MKPKINNGIRKTKLHCTTKEVAMLTLSNATLA